MAEGSRMWAISLLTTVLLFPLLSAAPLDIAGGVKDENDGMHSHDENITRGGKLFGHNRFDVRNINVSGSVAGDDVSIGHQVKIDVRGQTYDRYHHEDDLVKCKEGLREMFKSIDSNKDGLMDAEELLRVCHQNNIQITESLAVRILTLPDKTVGFNMAKFCELLKDCPSNNSAGLIHFLLQLFDKAPCSGTESDWNCCSSTSPCQENEGDCDTDDDCVGSLVCGKDNCKSINPLAYQLADCCIQPVTIEEHREFSPSRPQPKDTCPYKADLSAVLLENNWRAQSQIAAMSEDDKKNTVIVEVAKMTRHSGADLQARSIAGDLGSLTAIANMAGILIKYSDCISDVKTMTYELHLRNIIINAISKRSPIHFGTHESKSALLHLLNDHQLLETFCKSTATATINCEGLGLKGDDELRLYEHKEEAGRSLTIYGPTNLQQRNFNDLASSVHAVKGDWELYVHSDYSGNRMVVKQGQKINTDVNDVYSSARPICQYHDDPSTAKLKVYEHGSSQGKEKEFLNEEGDLGKDWSDKISSVYVIKGDWELYEHENYHGVREVVKEGDQIDIQHNDFHSSLRPICETYTYSPKLKCTPVRIEILDDPKSTPKFKGTKIIGGASGFSCNDPSTKTLTLDSVHSVTNSISLGISKSEGTDWSVGASATISATAGFMGSGIGVSGTISGSTGGSKSVTHEETDSSSTGNQKLVGSSTTYPTPGAAIAFGSVDLYEVDNPDVPVKIHLDCNGKMKERLSTMKLTRHTFQYADFFDFVKKIDNAGDCNKDGFYSKIDNCIRNVKAKYVNRFAEKEKMRKDFNDCFA